jgi:methionine synthase II (cobalamin-independent)
VDDAEAVMATAPYRAYTTTVVGAYSVPRWYEVLDRQMSLGELTPTDFADAQLHATQAAIPEQETAGIDVVTGGEMHRRTHNRHAPEQIIVTNSCLFNRLPRHVALGRLRGIADPQAILPGEAE